MANKRLALMILCGVCTLFSPVAVSAYSEDADMSQDEMMTYFPSKFVANTLEQYKVPQGQRLAIQNALSDKDQEVINLVEEKAAKMNPNPLRDPQMRQEAIKIFRDSLYEVFSKVMQAHGVTDKEELHSMLDDIQRQKAEYFARMIEEEKEEARRRREPSRQSLPRQPQGMEQDYRHSN